MGNILRRIVREKKAREKLIRENQILCNPLYNIPRFATEESIRIRNQRFDQDTKYIQRILTKLKESLNSKQ